MQAENFLDIAKGKFLFRVALSSTPKRLFYLASVLIVLGVVAGAIDQSWRFLLSIIPLLIAAGTVASLASLYWATNDVARMVESICPAFISELSFDEAIRDVFQQFPSKVLSTMLGIGSACLLFYSIVLRFNWKLVDAQTRSVIPRLTVLYILGLCLLAGLIFGFGLLGFVWSYQLIWRLRRERIVLFYAFRLRALSSYACTLAAIGLVPAIIGWLIYVQSGYDFWFFCVVILQVLVVKLSFLLTEMAIYKLISTARYSVLEVLAKNMNDLWNKLLPRSAITSTINDSVNGILKPPNNSENNEEVLNQIDKLEKLRQTVISYRIGIIDWHAFCGKIILPILIGVCVATCQLVMKHEMSIEVSPKLSPSQPALTNPK